MGNTPNIRFEGFTNDWEQRKLGELGTVQTCKRIFKEQTSEHGDIPFFKNGTIGLEPDSYISREVYEEFRRLYPYPEVGDTLISVVGSIGRTAEYTGEDEYFQDSNVVWLKTDGSINKKFLKVSYQVIKWLIEGSTVKHLYNDNILRSEIVMPSSQIEQAKIAEFFEGLDHLITLHQRKCEETKKLKKFMLQKMFPKKDETKPEIRFMGFTDDWEQRKCKEIFDRIANSVDVKAEETYREIGIRSHGKGLFYKDEVTGEELGNKRVFWVEPDCFIVNIVFAWERAVARTTEKELGMIASHRFPMYKPKNAVVDLDYITKFFVTHKGKYILEMASPGGAGRNKTLGQKEFEESVICLPSYEEQKKIGSYLDALDNLITLHQCKCDKLKELKKFMLQNMFI